LYEQICGFIDNTGLIIEQNFSPVEEALAISLYCSLKFTDDWLGGTLAAVNHSGDSDSTGSITGAILGTMNGLKAIPVSFIERLENQGQIKKMTDTCTNFLLKAKNYRMRVSSLLKKAEFKVKNEL